MMLIFLQLSSFKYTKDYDKDTTDLVKAFADNKFEQIWHSDKFGDASIQINPLTKKKSLDLWDLPRAELPSHVQLSPDSKVTIKNFIQDCTFRSIAILSLSFLQSSDHFHH